jgi:hypothetical protein
MRTVVQLVWYVDSLESEDPDVVLKVLEGVVAELHALTDEERQRLLDFVEVEAEAADSSRRAATIASSSSAISRSSPGSASRPEGQVTDCYLPPAASGGGWEPRRRRCGRGRHPEVAP